MTAAGAGGAGAVQGQKRLSPAPHKSSIHAGFGPILSTSAGAAGAFFYFFRKKRKGTEEGEKEKYRKSFKISPASPAPPALPVTSAHWS